MAIAPIRRRGGHFYVRKGVNNCVRLTQAILTEREVRIDVPDGPALYFPFVITRDPHIFDAVVERMLALSEHGAEPEALAGWMAREQIGTEQDRLRLVETYAHLRQLRVEGRNHIWGYVARNLSRPIWLSTPEQHVDAVIGNPPWL